MQTSVFPGEFKLALSSKTFATVCLILALLGVSSLASAAVMDCPEQIAELAQTPVKAREKKAPKRYLDNNRELTSNRLTLKPLRSSDIPFLEHLDSIPGVRELFGFGPDKPVLGAFNYERMLEPSSRTDHHYFAPWILNFGSEKVGYIFLAKRYARQIPDDLNWEIDKYLQLRGLPGRSLILSLGYVIHPDFRRQGFAEEAVKAVTDFALNDLQAAVLLPMVYKHNEASKGVLIKAGFYPNTFSNDEFDFFSSVPLGSDSQLRMRVIGD